MVDLRKIVIIFIIATLFTILVNTTIEAVYPAPKYDDFCKNEFGGYAFDKFVVSNPTEQKNCPEFKDVSLEEKESCAAQKGHIQYDYNVYGCPLEWKCSVCENQFMDKNKEYNLFVFIVSSILALFAIAVGLYLPIEKNNLHEWIATGFLLGGLITLFIGTARGFESLGRFIKPTVIALELALVIYIAYKKLNDDPKKK